MAVLHYHSALHRELDAPRVERFACAHGVAMVHDIMATRELPPEFSECDLFYSEIPWPSGFAKFDLRAGVPAGRTYAAFLERVGEILKGYRAAAVIVCGLSARNGLPATAHQPQRTTLLGRPAWAYFYGPHATPASSVVPSRHTFELLSKLALRYECVGDFCCGCGVAGRHFKLAGRRFVLSDYNATCIGDISQRYEHWK